MPQAATAVGINADSCRKGVCGELGAATGAVERQLMGTVNVDELRRDNRCSFHMQRGLIALKRACWSRLSASGAQRLALAD